MLGGSLYSQRTRNGLILVQGVSWLPCRAFLERESMLYVVPEPCRTFPSHLGQRAKPGLYGGHSAVEYCS